MNETFDGLNDAPPPYHIAINQINNRQNENDPAVPKQTGQPPPRYTDTRDEPMDSTSTNRTVWWNPNQLPGRLSRVTTHSVSNFNVHIRSLLAQRCFCPLENLRQRKWMIIFASFIILLIIGSLILDVYEYL